jgi:hypothetical protein
MSSIAISGDTSGTVSLAAPAVAGTNTITLPAGTGTMAVQGASTNIAIGNAQPSTSGTSVPFTGLPSWVKRITCSFFGVSTTGTANIFAQLGTGVTPTYTTSGYAGGLLAIGGVGSNFSSSFLLFNGPTAATLMTGTIVFTQPNTNIWSMTSMIAENSGSSFRVAAGYVTLSATLTAIQFATTDAFDAGSISIMYE